MRRVVLSMMVSVDNLIEPDNPQENWFTWDEEMAAYMMGFFKSVDTFIYGRKSYEVMNSFWPNATGEFADIMNQMPKLVFSKTLQQAEWNSTIISNIDTMKEIKRQPGKDLALFAGANITASFMQAGLIDEYRMIVNPVVLGSGKPLFNKIPRVPLRLVKSQTFACGNIILYYQPA